MERVHRTFNCDGATSPVVTDPDAVARALARLADGSHRQPEPDSGEPSRVVADAEAAMERIDAAAAFVGGGGEARLRRAVETADAAGDDDLAARGRTVLSTLAAFREAAGGAGAAPSSRAPETTSTPLAQPSSREGA